jgi:hypothetical protein
MTQENKPLLARLLNKLLWGFLWFITALIISGAACYLANTLAKEYNLGPFPYMEQL